MDDFLAGISYDTGFQDDPATVPSKSPANATDESYDKMARSDHRLSFERPIYELEARLEKLETKPEPTPEVRNEIRLLRRELIELKKRIYANLKPWETVEVARHPDRPMTTDYLELVFEEFVELHGDKTFGDDRAIRTGWAKLDAYKVLVVGHQKGKTLKERNLCNYGYAHPEGYRKAMAKMRLAAKFHMPVDLPDRHGRGLSGHRRRGARPGPGHRRVDVRDVAAADARHLRGHRRRGLGRGAGHRRGRPRGHARTRLLLGHQPRGLRRHPVEEPHLQGAGRRGAENDLQETSAAWA